MVSSHGSSCRVHPRPAASIRSCACRVHGDAHERFHVGILAAALNHCQMAPCDACQPGQYHLRHLPLYPDTSNDLTSGPVIIVHTQSPFLIGVCLPSSKALFFFADSNCHIWPTVGSCRAFGCSWVTFREQGGSSNVGQRVAFVGKRKAASDFVSVRRLN